jgi:NAD+ diphosphatase
MTAFDSFPLGWPAFVSNILDRAAHLRSDDAKLMALEGHRDARAYVVYRDSLVLKQEADGPRALLSIDEALKFGANPGTIFLGLRDGAAVFGMGISAAAVEKLLPRDDVAVTELRGMAMQGVVPPDQLSAIAMAKSMVSWHQRHGYCANCGTHRDEGRRLEARMSQLQGRAFSPHRSGRDHAGDLGRQMPAGAAKAISTRHVVVPCGVRRSR